VNPDSGWRALKRERVLENLSRAAITLATDGGGPDAVTVDAIAERAEVSRRTFFNYFPTKEAAFTWPLQAMVTHFIAALGARPDDEPIWDVIHHAVEETLTSPDTDLALVAEADALVSASPALLLVHDATASGRLPLEEGMRALHAEFARRLPGDLTRDPASMLVVECAAVALRVSTSLCARHGGDPRPHVASVIDQLRNGIRPARH
jgi:AcrR family transcriptional regulator